MESPVHIHSNLADRHGPTMGELPGGNVFTHHHIRVSAGLLSSGRVELGLRKDGEDFPYYRRTWRGQGVLSACTSRSVECKKACVTWPLGRSPGGEGQGADLKAGRFSV